jgi:hypothetical protein
MEGKRLYPSIAYFELAKEIPLSPIGSKVIICDADGRECLVVNGIELPIDTAIKEPDWFTPISIAEHYEMCYENSIVFLMARGKSREEARNSWNRFVNS